MDVTLKHIMLDLETLGTGDHAAIVQIGAVRFDPSVGESGMISTADGYFNAHIDLDDELLGQLDAPTVLWWMKQERDAQRRVFLDPVERMTLRQALARFHVWLRVQGEFEYLWSDMDFDLRLLRQAHERAGMPLPFTRKHGRDYRTLRWIGRDIPEPKRVGIKHDALDDAYHQAIHANNILRALRIAVPQPNFEGL